MLFSPLLAISRHPEGWARESALPPKADIRGARTIRTQKADIQCPLNPLKQTLETSSASEGSSGGSKPGRRWASMDLPGPGGPIISMWGTRDVAICNSGV